MKVLFVNPPRHDGLSVIREDRCEIVNRYLVNPPYSLIQMASVIREKGHDVRVIDANCTNLSYSEIRREIEECKPEVVVFRFTPATMSADMETARKTKTVCPNAMTVGICWTLRSFAEKIVQDNRDLDIYLVGEYGTYETTLLNVLEARNDGKPLPAVKGIALRAGKGAISTGPCNTCYPCDELPIPAYDLLPSLSKYYISPKHSRHSPFTIMYTSAGCPYSCSFCVVRQTRWRGQSADRVMKEIAYLKSEQNVRCIFFMDELFTYDRNRTLEICRRLIDDEIDLTWYTSTRVDLVDEALLEVMRAAGCRSISYGIESGSQRILDRVGKGTSVDQALQAIKMTKDVGMRVHLSFIIGLPGENRETVNETVRFAKKASPAMAQFNVAVPYPGTPLYYAALSKGWIEPELDYAKLQHQVSIMRTDDMTTQEIEQARKKAYRSLYFHPKWIASQVTNLTDLSLTMRHYVKCLGMYLFHRMEHSH